MQTDAELRRSENAPPYEMSLATALTRFYGGRVEWFGSRGRNPPYVKVALRPVRGTTMLEPALWRHRLGDSRRVIAKLLLAHAESIKFSQTAYSEFSKSRLRRWFGDQSVPFDRWLALYHYRGPPLYDVGSTDLYVLNDDTGRICCVTLAVLCLGEGVQLRMSRPPPQTPIFLARRTTAAPLAAVWRLRAAPQHRVRTERCWRPNIRDRQTGWSYRWLSPVLLLGNKRP
jgi:hypothetical protein